MSDSRIFDRARLGQELDDLNAEHQSDMNEAAVSPREVSEFQAVTAAIKAVLEEAEVERMSHELTPGLHAVVGSSKVERALAQLAPAQREAVQKLFTAATAHDAGRNTYVSALERNTLLNQALMHLQPLLALALRPDFLGGRSVYHELVGQLNDVRRDILSGILAQGVEQVSQSLEIDITEGGDEDEPGAGSLADPDLDAEPGAVPDPDLNAAPPDAAAPAAPDPETLADPALEPDAGVLADPDLDAGADAGADPNLDPIRGAGARRTRRS